MLLSLMRKHAKSYLIKFLIAIIAVVFIFYFGYSFRSREGLKIAEVNGEVISGVEYQKAYRNLLEGLQREYKSVWNDSLIKVFDLKNRALKNLINRKLFSQEARRIGLDVTDKEIQEQILAYPAFQFKGQFDESRYRALLQNNRMNPEDFEAGIAQELLRGKVEQFLSSFMPVTDQEVLDYYTFVNEKVKISFVQFLSENFRESVKVDPKAMEAYFSEHKETYRVPEKVKLSYIVLDPDQFRDKVTVTDSQVRDYYEENIESFRVVRQVKARHILFKLEEGASGEVEKEVRERALSVLKKARDGEDFSDLAKKYSEGPTRKDGGDLGYFSAGQMVKPFEEAVFKLKKGEISDLVRTPFGYHIILVEDIKEARTKGLDEMAEQIAGTIKDAGAADLAHEKALSLTDQMPYDVNLARYAREHDVEAKETRAFSRNDPIPDIGGDDKLRESLFSLQKNEVSELIELEGKFYIFQIAEKIPSYLPESKEVQEALKEDYTSHLALAEARAAAEGYLSKLKAGEPWAATAKEKGLTPETTDFFSRSDSIPRIGHVGELQESAFALDDKNPYPEGVFEAPAGVFVIRWEQYQGVDFEKYREDKEKTRWSLERAKQRVILGDWLEELRKRAEIEVLHSLDS